MPNPRRNKPRKAGEVDDANEANTDRTSLDGEDEEDANASASGQVDEEANILAAIRLLRADVSTQMREVITSNQEIKEAIAVFSERLTSAETRISKVEDDISSLASKESSLQKKVHELTLKLDDLENRHRRSNLRLIGLPEGTEGGDAVSFLQTWLPEVLGTDALPSPIIIERAHRLPGRQAPNDPPRAIIMKFLNYQDKVKVMKAARQRGKVMYRDRHIMFFPDLSTVVQKQRRQYDGVKQQLRELNIGFGLIFPARMRIFHQGSRNLFHTAAEVEDFIRRVRQQSAG